MGWGMRELLEDLGATQQTQPAVADPTGKELGELIPGHLSPFALLSSAGASIGRTQPEATGQGSPL